MESCPTQAVLPLVGLAANTIIRDRYTWHADSHHAYSYGESSDYDLFAHGSISATITADNPAGWTEGGTDRRRGGLGRDRRADPGRALHRHRPGRRSGHGAGDRASRRVDRRERFDHRNRPSLARLAGLDRE
ncbi:MAG: hypothetical protein R6U98_08450 [Pirellulaceae bacterium]